MSNRSQILFDIFPILIIFFPPVSIMYSVIQQIFLNAYYVPGTILGTGKKNTSEPNRQKCCPCEAKFALLK